MRRWMSLMLILLLAVGLCVPAVAEDLQVPTAPPYTDEQGAWFKVIYQMNGGTTDANKERPEVVFEYVVAQKTPGATAGESGAAYPSDNPSVPAVAFDETAINDGIFEKTATINLPDYTNVGIYEYVITQKTPTQSISGVTYFSQPIYLKVTVIEQNGKISVAAVHIGEEDGTKRESVINNYQCGSLAITKEVTGNMGDQNQYFDVTVKLTAPAGTTPSTDSKVAISTGSATNPENATTMDYGDPGTTIRIKHGETITLSNIAAGTTYTVTEADYTAKGEEGKGYDAPGYTFSDDTNKRIDSGDADTVKIVNNKGVPVDTGISLDNAPYLLLLAVVVAAGAMLLLKRRHREKD